MNEFDEKLNEVTVQKQRMVDVRMQWIRDHRTLHASGLKEAKEAFDSMPYGEVIDLIRSTTA